METNWSLQFRGRGGEQDYLLISGCGVPAP